MKIYSASVYIGNYEIQALGESPQKCISVLVSAYRKNFGTFSENGFKNKADWLEYHGISESSCDEFELNSAIIK